VKIAAVVPVYNRARVLGRAVESIISQSYPLTEIIIVDDGSTDEAMDVARSFDDRRIRILHQAHKGAAAARNLGWRSAQADFIAFLDSDDTWSHEKVARQVESFRDETLVACFTGYEAFNHENRYIPPAHSTDLLELQKANILGPTSVSLIRRSALEDVGGFDESLPSCQDWDLWIKLRRIGNFRIVAVPLVQFEQLGQDRISRNYTAVVEGHKQLFRRILADLSDDPNRPIVASMHAARMSLIMADCGKLADATRYAAKSFFLRPNRYALSLLAGASVAVVRSASQAHFRVRPEQ
jgi:glycosyltransferase involved in cell wall biosynthesis